MAHTGPVKIRQGQIDQLINLYKQTYAKLTREIITASDAGKIQKARVMARINLELEALGVQVDKWARREIPQYYLDGANVAVQDLRALGVEISKSKNFAVINAEAIKALTDEVALAFGQSITAISSNSRRLLSDALKQQLNYIVAEGKLTGETRKFISAGIKQAIQDNGITALTDKAGKNWTFDNYARMLARTKAVEGRNQGLTNRMLTSGYDLVQVSNHGTDHPACAFWESKILSLTGKTPGYPTLEEAKSRGLFHPNCEHAVNVFIPELAALTKAYDNPYNWDNAAAKDAATPYFKGPGATGLKPKPITVYRGTGASAPGETDLFGSAHYVARSKDIAKEFGGKVTAEKVYVDPRQILTISTDKQYNALIRDTISAYPGEDIKSAIPKFVKSRGFKAIEGTPSYDPLAGLAIFDSSIIQRILF